MRLLYPGSVLSETDYNTLQAIASGTEVQVLEDSTKNMRSQWDQIAQQHKQYEGMLDEFQAYMAWRTQATPERVVQPLGEDDMPQKLINGWLIGCDPEFVAMDARGQIVNTEGTIPHAGVVGYDHSGDVIEIRPEPAHGTYILIKRLQKEILHNEHLAKLAQYKWRAGAYVQARTTRGTNRVLTLGGHVHLDMPPKQYGEDPEVHDLRIAALDRVTDWLEKLDILPLKESIARRTDPNAVRLHYGQFSDWRPAGGTGVGAKSRMEYRTMCSWLVDPKVAYLALTTAKIAASMPQLTLDGLKKGQHSWPKMGTWMESYRFRDSNVRRALEKLWDAGKQPKVDPTESFRERWQTLGL